jgi:hypothetical protein
MCFACLCTERRGILVRDCEMLTAAVIPLTLNFQYAIGFANRDVFRERISHS